MCLCLHMQTKFICFYFLKIDSDKKKSAPKNMKLNTKIVYFLMLKIV